MKIIVAVDKEWGIGKNNDLLFHLPLDMKYFREQTSHKIVAMGSNTLASFPGGNPLPNRTNIVLFPGGEKRADCQIVDSLQELASEFSKYNSDDIFIIGGAYFYHTMLPYCDEALITKVDSVGGATVFFDNLDKLDNWQCISESETLSTNGFDIKFTKYKNNEVKKFL